MKNRIEELVRKGAESRSAFEKEIAVLEQLAKSNPVEKEQLYKEFQESLNKRGTEIREIAVRKQMESVSEIISLSYIARHYFNKSRQWLNHRINGNIVNGKPAKFTPDQINTLNLALKDISKKIGSLHVR